MKKEVRKKMTGRKIDQDTGIPVSSIWEAAFLVYNDVSFLRTKVLNHRTLFIFPDSPKTKKVLQIFMSSPEVRLQEFIGIFQRVKNIIYREKDKEKGEDYVSNNKSRKYF